MHRFVCIYMHLTSVSITFQAPTVIASLSPSNSYSVFIMSVFSTTTTPIVRFLLSNWQPTLSPVCRKCFITMGWAQPLIMHGNMLVKKKKKVWFFSVENTVVLGHFQKAVVPAEYIQYGSGFYLSFKVRVSGCTWQIFKVFISQTGEERLPSPQLLFISTFIIYQRVSPYVTNL